MTSFQYMLGLFVMFLETKFFFLFSYQIENPRLEHGSPITDLNRPTNFRMSKV